MHLPEFESGSTAWKAAILTTVLQMLYMRYTSHIFIYVFKYLLYIFITFLEEALLHISVMFFDIQDSHILISFHIHSFYLDR